VHGDAMPQYDFHDVSILIPVRIENEDRLANLEAVLRYFDTFFLHHETVLVETGPESKCRHLGESPGVLFEFIAYDGPFWKTRLLNRALAASTRDIVAMHDADTLFNPDALNAMATAFRRFPDVVFGIPHNGTCLDVGGSARQRLLETLDFSTVPFVEEGEVHRRYGEDVVCTSPYAAGGANYYRKTTLLELGGFNESFQSHGWEDFEIEARFVKMGYPPCVIKDSNVLHLHHERGPDSRPGPAYDRNELLYRRIARMTRDQLEEYIRSGLRTLP